MFLAWFENDYCDADTVCKSLHNVRKTYNHADTICQGFSQGLCQERICQKLKPWQVHLRWADLLVILLLEKLLANIQLPRLLAFCQGFCPCQNATFLVVIGYANICLSVQDHKQKQKKTLIFYKVFKDQKRAKESTRMKLEASEEKCSWSQILLKWWLHHQKQVHHKHLIRSNITRSRSSSEDERLKASKAVQWN